MTSSRCRSVGKDGSVFTLQKNGDSPVITYTSDADFSSVKSVSEGDRLILCYKRKGGAVYTSGDVIVYGFVRLTNTEKSVVRASASDFNGWSTRPLKVNSLWRTGSFINIDTDIFVYKAAVPQMMALVCDEATIDSPMPELHVVYINADDNDGDNPYTVYASVDISALWDMPSCQGVMIVYPSPSGTKSIKFEKNF